ncbi:MAG: NUMOD3 domain-containing DNA-binding protein [Nitrososphaeraceae archaeon]
MVKKKKLKKRIGKALRSLRNKLRHKRSPFKGKKHTEEAKLKNSLAHKDKVVSLKTRKRMSKSKTGIKFTKQRKQNISKALKGRKFTDESRLKMSLAQQGKKRGPHSEEQKRKIASSNRRTWTSKELRKQDSERVKKWWADRKKRETEQ